MLLASLTGVASSLLVGRGGRGSRSGVFSDNAAGATRGGAVRSLFPRDVTSSAREPTVSVAPEASVLRVSKRCPTRSATTTLGAWSHSILRSCRSPSFFLQADEPIWRIYLDHCKGFKVGAAPSGFLPGGGIDPQLLGLADAVKVPRDWIAFPLFFLGSFL
jgi:hypothetical protein